MTDQPKRRRWLRALNVIFLAVGLIALALMVNHVGWERITSGVRRVGIGFALICAIHFADICLDSIILRACAGDDGRDVPYHVFLRASLSGHAINEAVPFNSVGEVTKLNLLREHLPGTTAAAALIVQNLVRFTTMSALIACAAPISLALLDVSRPATIVLIVTSAGFAMAGIISFWLLARGIGEMPLRVARRLGVSEQRVDGWRVTWTRVRTHWANVAASGSYMRTSWLASVCARTSSLCETAVILYLLGVDNLFAMSFLTMANYQVVVWATSFIPFQAGTTEGGAYFLFKSVGAGAAVGVLVELVRRARRLTFIALGVVLLGYKAVTPPSSE